MEGILPWKAVQSLQFTEEGFLLEHYIPKTGITLIHGKYSTYKTPLTIHMAKAVATGEDLWGLKVTKTTPVLYLEMDTPPDATTRRMQSIGGEAEELDIAFYHPGFDVVNYNSNTRSRIIYNALRKAHEERKYKMVVVDSLRCVHRLKSVDDDTPIKVYDSLVTLFNGAVIVVVHHDNKTRIIDRNHRPSDAEIAQMSAESFAGSQGWINHATIAIHIKLNGNSESVVLAHTKSQAGERQQPLLINLPDGGAIALSSSGDISDELKTIVRTMKGKGDSLAVIDKKVAEFLQVSIRTARRKRREIFGDAA
jgi:hypothetical protein